MLMQQTTPEKYVTDLMQSVGYMMEKFHVHDPNVFFEMPSVMFDELCLNVSAMQKAQKVALPTGKKGGTFG